MAKNKLTIYIDPQVRELLDGVYIRLIEMNDKRTYGDIISALILQAFKNYEQECSKNE